MSKNVKFGVATVSLAIIAFLVLGQMGVHAGSDGGAYKQLGVYSEVLSHIRNEYVEEPNMPAVTDGALHGLLESLDSNSSYMAPAEFKLYKEQMSRPEFTADIGAVLSKHYGYGFVVSVWPGSPAEKAGMENGDILESIDGKTSHEMSVAEIRARMRGIKGSQVNFNVIRARKVDPFKLTAIRDSFSAPQNTDKMLDGNVAYLRLWSLTKDRVADLATKIKSAQSSGAKKFVIDLRATADGEPADGAAAANLFLEKGEIAEVHGQQFAKQEITADAQKQITKLPLVLLVNRYTANAAEVLAAALQDDSRAQLVGEKTFGSASIQKEFDLPDGGALLLSVAKFYSPSGKAIQDALVTPGTIVANDAVDAASIDDDEDGVTPPAEQITPKKKEPKSDEALNKALEILKKS